MRAILKPNINNLNLLRTCINSIDDAGTVAAFNLIETDISAAANQYDLNGQSKTLYTIPPNNSHKDTVLIGGLTKKELTSLYTQQMVARTKPARHYYDVLRISAPQGVCPFCGIGAVKTLDHYLPKSKFPLLSVLSLNLVPACRDCNTEKLAILATSAGEQTLHPYYDHQEFITDQWLFGSVEQTVPIAISYFVNAPPHWSATSARRVQTHFNSYGLDAKFSTQASTEISSLLPLLKNHFALMGHSKIQSFLQSVATTELNLHRNSWKAAMYQALANNNWFCNTGYRLY
jgi:hypothetical protein